MKDRCYNLNSQKYPWYGAKGVVMCDEWLEDPLKFIEWAENNNWKPGMEIDKDIKFPGNNVYSPEMCSLVSHKENMCQVVKRRNTNKTSKMKLFIYEVEEIKLKRSSGVPVADLAIEYSVTPATIYAVTKRLESSV